MTNPEQVQTIEHGLPQSLPQHLPRLPWKEMLLALIVLIIAGGIISGVSLVLQNRGTTAVVSQRPVAQPGQQVPQNVQENVGIAVPVVVDYRVVWTEVQGFDPSTISVEEGFYNGTLPYTIAWSPTDPNDIPAGDAYAWEILPQLKEVGRGTRVAAVRAGDVVLVTLDANRYGPYILLSVDGEKSWYKLNLLWEGVPYGDATRVRVTLTGDEIHLYGKDSRPGNHWWTVTIKRSDL